MSVACFTTSDHSERQEPERTQPLSALESTSNDPTGHQEETEAQHSAEALIDPTEDLIGWKSDSLVQKFTGINFNSLRVTDNYLLPDGTTQFVEYLGSARFDVMYVACGGLDHYVLYGPNRAGELVAELWTLEPTTGYAVVQGGTAQGAVPRIVPKEFHRELILRDFVGSEVRGIELDPQGRFAICALRRPDGSGAVYQILIGTGLQPPNLLYDSSSIPELAKVSSIEKGDHALLGRVYQLSTPLDDDAHILLVDANNDGVFDGSPIVGSYDYLDTLQLFNIEDWDPLTGE